MDLLETVLRSANAEDYIEVLRNHNLEAAILPALTDNDLEILGVDKQNVRKEIILKASTLQIPHEKLISLTINREYVELVLSQISQQLQLHDASLSCAVNRKDIMVCDLKLRRASECLLQSITLLEKELDQFEYKFGSRGKRKPRRRYLLISLTALASTVSLLMLGVTIKNCISK